MPSLVPPTSSSQMLRPQISPSISPNSSPINPKATGSLKNVASPIPSISVTQSSVPKISASTVSPTSTPTPIHSVSSQNSTAPKPECTTKPSDTGFEPDIVAAIVVPLFVVGFGLFFAIIFGIALLVFVIDKVIVEKISQNAPPRTVFPQTLPT